MCYIIHTTYFILHTRYHILIYVYCFNIAYILHTTYHILYTTYYLLKSMYCMLYSCTTVTMIYYHTPYHAILD